jgi:hypothetical protein
MTPYLHAAWLPDEELVGQYQKVVGALPGVLQTAGYRAAEKSEAMQTLGKDLSRLDIPGLRERPAKAWVLAELESLTVGGELAELLGEPDASSADPISGEILAQALLHEINDVPGPLPGDGGFAPAHQFGVYGLDSVKAEWRLHLWYERHRLVEVATMPGMIRTRRYAVIAGPARCGILYEFPSVQARLEGFEAFSEAKGLDPNHPNAPLRDYTVHAPGAPFVGSRIS